MLYVEVHLTKLSFFKRLKYAIMYIMGSYGHYSAYEETLLTAEGIEELKKIL